MVSGKEMTVFQKIVVPLDGSQFGEHALPHACAIATRCNAVLRLVHVHSASVSPVYVEGQPVIDENLRSLHHQHEQRYLERIKERLVGQMSGFTIEVEAYDRPLESIVNESVGEFLAKTIAARSDVDLIVMATHGRGGASRLWLGSVADALLHLSHVPLLLVRPQSSEPDFTHLPTYQNILIALDGSPLSEQILDPAQTLGDLMAAEYTLLQVIPPLPTTFGPTAEQLVKANAQGVQQAQAYLSQVAQRRAQSGQRVHYRASNHNNVATAILEDAARYHHDLIAMATHGQSGLRRLVIGSVTDKVVRGATLPVLVHRPKQ